MKVARVVILLAAITLFCGGLAHIVGYTFIVPVLLKSNLEPRIVSAIKCVWLVFSFELFILSPALVWISRKPGNRSLLLYLSVLPIVEAVMMYHFVGLFLGTYMIGAGAILLVIGAWLLPQERNA